MMKITGLFHLFKWENLHNWWLTKYFFAPLYISFFSLCLNSNHIVLHTHDRGFNSHKLLVHDGNQLYTHLPFKNAKEPLALISEADCVTKQLC